MNNTKKDIWEKLYKGYVIKEIETNTFIGLSMEMYRVFHRSLAGRFTKKEALEYIGGKGMFIEDNKTYFIEDAT